MSSYHMYIVRSFLIITGLALIVAYIVLQLYKYNQVIPEDLDIPDDDEEQIDIADIL
jgi:heme/copper-type cytochrome/quinol oxidase subunit 3